MSKIDWEQRHREMEFMYGTDARQWMYRDFDYEFVKTFRFRYLKGEYPNNWEFQANFVDKRAFNFPGPFYTADTDTCGTGPVEAPNNILVDHDYLECIFIQPRTTKEFMDVFSAAIINTFAGYGIDGNDHWTLESIRTWWSEKDQLIEQLKSPPVIENNNGQNFRYIDYLNGEAKSELRRYAYFLEHRTYPLSATLLLPEID